MKDTIGISIRMPKLMMDELVEITKSEYFMDVSETVRSIIRLKWNELNSEESEQKNKVYDLLVEKILKKNI